ncbi:hypothetical protein NP493_1691g00049 [Ridgeia piscesae]|uniref:Uncharacterized protein n=1 Tax=Ridgeia piscesae TaxID=27915 RepID=A0AAD9JUQ2_RIDPI|nr:hypothetical protein NP493_1691g00049 [Ridgeia piscesae]
MRLVWVSAFLLVAVGVKLGDTIHCYSCEIVGEMGNSHCADPTKYTDVEIVSCDKCLMDVVGSILHRGCAYDNTHNGCDYTSKTLYECICDTDLCNNASFGLTTAVSEHSTTAVSEYGTTVVFDEHITTTSLNSSASAISVQFRATTISVLSLFAVAAVNF